MALAFRMGELEQLLGQGPFRALATTPYRARHPAGHPLRRPRNRLAYEVALWICPVIYLMYPQVTQEPH